MKTSLYIPANFDANKLIADKYGKQRKKMCPWMLMYICDRIFAPYLYYKEKYRKRDVHQSFTSLKSTYLKNINSNYIRHLNFLIEQGVIISDRKWQIGFKSIGFKLAENYMHEDLIQVPIENNSFIKKINYHKEMQRAKNPELDKLYKVRAGLLAVLNNKGFTINSEKALAEVNKVYAEKEAELKPDDRLRGYQLYKHKMEKYALKAVVGEINSKPCNVVIDKSGYRLHTPVTRLPKYLRKYLSINGQQLKAWDIKNSQPYLSILLLSHHNFYHSRAKIRGELILRDLDSELYGLIKPQLQHIKPITLQDYPETLENIGDLTLKNYMQNAINGLIYDNLVVIPKGEHGYDERRDAIKERFMELLFDEPRDTIRNRYVKEQYATPFKVFDLIKSVHTGRHKYKELSSSRNRRKRLLEEQRALQFNNQQNKNDLPVKRIEIPPKECRKVDLGYTKLATLLQRVESKIVLDIICKRLLQKYPSIPLITIHDSIATTDEYLKIVEDEMKECFAQIIGVAPKLNKEKWFEG